MYNLHNIEYGKGMISSAFGAMNDLIKERDHQIAKQKRLLKYANSEISGLHKEIAKLKSKVANYEAMLRR